MTPLRPAPSKSFVAVRLAGSLLALAAGLMPVGPLQAQSVSAPVDPAPWPHVLAAPAVNHAPVAHDDNLVAFAGEQDQPLLVLANDTDPDGGDVLNVFSVSLPQHGVIDGRWPNELPTFVMYQPDVGFTGVDTFTYVVEDRPQFTGGLMDTGLVTVTVVPPNAVGATNSAFAVNACVPSPAGCDTSLWKVNPNSGASSVTGACNGTAGLGIQDVYSWNYELEKAFDTGQTVWINGQQFVPRLPLTVTHDSLVSGPVPMSNVRVTVHYDGLFGTADTLRTQVMLGNATGTPKSITVTLASNLGTNAQTVIAGTSLGDTQFTPADRWLVTTKSGGAPFKLVDTHVLFGPGSPPVQPSAVYTSTFTCGENPPNDEGVRADFHVTVPANSVRRLLFFTQIHQTSADALADATTFNAEPVGLLNGLTNAQLAQVLNWNLAPLSQTFLPVLRR